MERLVRPKAQILEALKGKISEPVRTVSNKPGFVGQEVEVRLVKEGPGMVGLGDWQDNKEWSGILNHFVKTAGAAVKIGKLLELNREQVDVQLLLDTVLLSHSGRRQFDEAQWYPEIVESAQGKAKTPDSFLTIPILRKAGVNERIIEMVSVHTLGAENGYRYEDMDDWNKKLPMYLDFRIAQEAMPLEKRFADLQRAVAAGRITREALDRLHEWAMRTEQELFDALWIEDYDWLVDHPRHLLARIKIARELGRFSADEEKLLIPYIKSKELRLSIADTPSYVLGLSKEDFMEYLELNPEDINDTFLRPGRWERYLRRLYVNDAEEEIFNEYGEAQRLLDQYFITDGIIDESLVEKIKRQFPETTWWGRYVRELYEIQHGLPYEPRHGKAVGIERAIDFFKYLDFLSNTSSNTVESGSAPAGD